MNEDQLNTLREKKQQLRLKLEVRDHIRRHLKGWLPLMDHLLQKNISFRLLFLACVRDDTLPYWEAELKSDLLWPYGFTRETLVTSPFNPSWKKPHKAFPTSHPFGYIPDLPLTSRSGDDWQEELTRAVRELGMKGETVMFFYGRLTPAVIIAVDELIRLDVDLVNMADELIICSPDYLRIIYRTLENDWYWGRK